MLISDINVNIHAILTLLINKDQEQIKLNNAPSSI